jgi:hypothetical protein
VEPDAPAQRVVYCSSVDDVAIIEGFAYPPTLQRPAGADIQACLPDLASARAAGYDVPPSRNAVAGFHLRSDDWVTETCVEAAVQTGRQVPCPALIPHGGTLTSCRWCVENDGFMLHVSGFATPDGWCRDCGRQLVVVAAPRDQRNPILAYTSCGPEGSRRAGRHLECNKDAPGELHPHARHTLRRGLEGETAYAVSVEGFGPRQRALVDAVFDSLVFIRG